MRTKLIIAILFIPLIFAFIFSTAVTFIHADAFNENSLTIEMYMIMIVQCSLASFILFSIARRSRNHSIRDNVWMRSLTDYVRSYGGDVSKLEKINDGVVRKHTVVVTGFSLVIAVITMLSVIYLGLLMSNGMDAMDARISEVIFYPYVLLMIQFIVTIGASIGFPNRHERAQVEFTKEFSVQASKFGLNVEPMKQVLSTPHTIVNVILFVFTLGLYTLVLIPISCYRMNLHMYNQWHYESELMTEIIKKEGGTGVEGIRTTEDPNMIIMIIKNLM